MSVIASPASLMLRSSWAQSPCRAEVRKISNRGKTPFTNEFSIGTKAKEKLKTKAY
jgi:hypothetical protein